MMLSERTWLFLLSLAIAVILWFYVDTTAQSPSGQSPTASLRLHNVEVSFSGLADGWRASANPPAVDVEMRWPAPSLLAVRPADVRAIADVHALEPGPHQVTLRIQVPAGVTTVQTTPPSVVVTLLGP